MATEPEVRIDRIEVLSKAWATLSRYSFGLLRRDGQWSGHVHESYDHGHGAAVLLYNRARRSVVLIRQFRLPPWLCGHRGRMLEVCAGLLDGDDPAACVRREALEETGYAIGEPRQVLVTWMSPGSLTERLHLFVAEYDPHHRPGAGGGLEGEGEDIEVLEMPFDEALALVAEGHIVDAKTVMLLQHAALAGLMA